MNNTQNQNQQPTAISMADLLANFSPVTPKRHSLVSGEIIAISKQGALVHVGAKSESTIDNDEVLELGLTVGFKGHFFVMSDADENGSAVLSLKAAQSWNELKSLKESGATVEVTVKTVQKSKGTSRVSGAIAVIGGLRGFIPASHLSARGSALDSLAGTTIRVKVLEADPALERSSIVLSQRKADEEMRESFLASIQPGAIVGGRVTGFGKKTIGDREDCYGAFVDLGCGLSGLVHKSELSADRTQSPADVVKLGDELQLVVLNVDIASGKVGLSLKQAAQVRALGTIAKGQIVVGKVMRKKEYGAFIDVGGIDGLLHVSEIPGGQTDPKKAIASLEIGSEVKVVVIKVSDKDKQVGLSLTQVPANS